MTEVKPFELARRGTIMTADPHNPHEAWGVLNPACCRGRDGQLYLFPRLVAEGNYSRIGRARVQFADNEPMGVARLGYALEPTEGFERNERTAGVEDPRITFIAVIDRYVMTYVAYGPCGPRVALAISYDAQHWQRLGPAKWMYTPAHATDFDLYDNKDALVFPEPVRAPNGQLALAMIHRPDYNINRLTETPFFVQPRGILEPRPAMWVSYAPLESVQRDLQALQCWYDHHMLAAPEQPWEALKVGGGTPPVLTRHGWLTIFHGVAGAIVQGVDHQPLVRYTAGVLILDRDDPRKVLYRSRTPVLEPRTADEQQGIVNNVVFPTAVDVRSDDEIDVYYGMADARIGLARLVVPQTLSP